VWLVTGREQVDWLVFERVWSSVQDHVQEEFGETEGYLSRTVETAMRESIGEHRYEPVEQRVRDLVGNVGAEKTETTDVSTFTPTEYNEKTRIGVYVDEALLLKWKKHVDQHLQYSYGVALSQHLEYYLQGGRPASLANQLDRVINEIKQEDNESQTTAEEIIDQLDERFSLEEFHAAATNADVTTTKYAVSEYLPRVINEMDVQPLPTDNSRFFPISSNLVPEPPNPALLPYHAMTDDDKRLTLKIAAIKAAVDTDSEITTFGASDGVAALDGRPQHSTVRSLMRDLDHERIPNGISYDVETQELKIKYQKVEKSREDHEDALSIIARLRKADDSEREQDSTMTHWIGRAADLLDDLPCDVGDPVINNKIARAKHSDYIEEVPMELCNRVTPVERMKVKEYLGWPNESPVSVTTAEPMDWGELKASLRTKPECMAPDA